MAEQIIKDSRGRKLGIVTQDTRGNLVVYDALRRKRGTIRNKLFGKREARDKINRPIAEYDPRRDETKTRQGQKIKGDALVELLLGL